MIFFYRPNRTKEVFFLDQRRFYYFIVMGASTLFFHHNLKLHFHMPFFIFFHHNLKLHFHMPFFMERRKVIIQRRIYQFIIMGANAIITLFFHHDVKLYFDTPIRPRPQLYLNVRIQMSHLSQDDPCITSNRTNIIFIYGFGLYFQIHIQRIIASTTFLSLLSSSPCRNKNIICVAFGSHQRKRDVIWLLQITNFIVGTQWPIQPRILSESTILTLLHDIIVLNFNSVLLKNLEILSGSADRDKSS